MLKFLAFKNTIVRQEIGQHNRIHSNHTISLFCLDWNEKICEKNKVTSVNMFIDVNIIEFSIKHIAMLEEMAF